jgi:hypothetical protein
MFENDAIPLKPDIGLASNQCLHKSTAINPALCAAVTGKTGADYYTSIIILQFEFSLKMQNYSFEWLVCVCDYQPTPSQESLWARGESADCATTEQRRMALKCNPSRRYMLCPRSV